MLLTPDLIMNIIITSIIVSSIVFGISYAIVILPLKRNIKEEKIMIQSALNKLSLITEREFDTGVSIDSIESNVESLTSSFDTYIIEKETIKKNGIYPNPSLAEEITKTIKDELAIEIILNSKTEIPKAGIIERIAINTKLVYPDINDEWLIRKISAVMEATEIGVTQ